MPKLQDFSFNVPNADDFMATMRTAGLTFPGVQQLLLGALSESLISLCPNVRTIRTSKKHVWFTGSWVNGEPAGAIEMLNLVLDAEYVAELNIDTWTLGMVNR